MTAHAGAGRTNWPTQDHVPNSNLDWQYKGWPTAAKGIDMSRIGDQKLNLFDDGFMFPVMVIAEADLDHNIATVAEFCETNGISLAPHGKTTMSPEIAHRQLDAGAWAITASTASQARIYRAFGVNRIVIAHQVVDPAGLTWMADELRENSDVEILCLVDSVAGVDVMDAILREQPPGRPIDVLVELGMQGGRTGARTHDEAIAVAERVGQSNHLRLVGAEGYEGILHFQGEDFTEVDSFLKSLRTLTERLNAEGHFDHLEEIIVTAGGSMFPDRVVALLGGDWELGRPVRPVIRPGGYVTHDSVLYTESGPFGVRAPMDTCATLQPAMCVWAYVLSRPEPGLAILGFGKRDASFDIDLPVPALVRRDGELMPVDDQLKIVDLNDQHAYVQVSEGFELAIGDLIGCGISHPCASFDRWRAMPLIDSNYVVTGAVRTFF